MDNQVKLNQINQEKQLADQCSVQKNFDQAIIHYCNIIQICVDIDISDKENAQIKYLIIMSYMNLCFIHMQKKEFQKALEYGQQAIKIDPNNSDCYHFCSNCCYNLGNIKESYMYNKNAIKFMKDKLQNPNISQERKIHLENMLENYYKFQNELEMQMFQQLNIPKEQSSQIKKMIFKKKKRPKPQFEVNLSKSIGYILLSLFTGFITSRFLFRNALTEAPGLAIAGASTAAMLGVCFLKEKLVKFGLGAIISVFGIYGTLENYIFNKKI